VIDTARAHGEGLRIPGLTGVVMPLRHPLTRRSFIRRVAQLGSVSLLGACADEETNTPDADAVTPDNDAAGDAGTDTATDDTGTSDGATELSDVAPPCAPVVTLAMVHVNDLHANYGLDSQGSSPVARIVGYWKQVQASQEFPIFTNAGDDFEKGSVAECMSDGESTLQITKLAGFDVRCIGNHDFAWGEETMLSFSDDPTGQTLSSNVSYSGPNPERWKAQSTVILERGCVRIGYFGMVGKPWNEFNEQYDGDFFANFPMRHDYVERAREIVAELRPQVDVLIMLSHLGLGTDREIAAAVDGIDIVLGGHSHSIVNPEEIVNDTIIIQAGSSAAWIAQLDVDVDTTSKEITGYRYALQLNSTDVAPTDEATNDAIRTLLTELAPSADEVVGRASESLSPPEMAALLARACISVLECDAALVDRSTAWVTLATGDVTPQEFIRVFTVERQPAGTPGYNSMGRGTVSGATLQLVRDAVPNEWGWAGPDMIDPTATYRIALQRHVAGRFSQRFGETAALQDFALMDECWSVLTDWSRQQTALGKAIDAA
jgi:5'-nucleotidase / UDP-sugar diphosphatase